MAGGIHAVQWNEVGRIAMSWVISPALSGLFAFLIFSTLQRKILFAMNPINATRRFIPVMVFVVLFVFTLSILFNGLGSFQVTFSLAETLLIGSVMGLIGALIAFSF